MRRFVFPALVVVVSACGTTPVSTFGADGGDVDSGVANPNGDDGGNPFGQVDASAPDSAVSACVPDPANFDIPKNGCDDDGDGVVDNAPACDTGLPLTGDAMQFAKALGLCQMASAGKWGIVSAVYTDSFGSSMAPVAEQHGILSKFGNVLKPREGASLGVISSGYAREYDECGAPQSPFKGGCPMNVQTNASAPQGYPKDSPNCLGVVTDQSVNDMITVKLTIKVPHNAKGLAFDFNFGSGEWPEFVCTTFNDAFIAYLTSKAFNSGKPDNISFDSKNNPVSVNNGFFDRCSPKGAEGICSGVAQAMGGKKGACAGGDSELRGTGFYNPDYNCDFNMSTQDSGGGMTGWLTTKAPVAADETITIEFMVWDTGDHSYDSSVLLDNWQWQGDPTAIGTDRPPVN